MADRAELRDVPGGGEMVKAAGVADPSPRQGRKASHSSTLTLDLAHTVCLVPQRRGSLEIRGMMVPEPRSDLRQF